MKESGPSQLEGKELAERGAVDAQLREQEGQEAQIWAQNSNFSSIFFFFAFFRAALMAYGGSQAGGPIGAVATGLHHSHSHAGSKPHL